MWLGPLAQLVERHVYTVNVIGSIPVGPTKFEIRIHRVRIFSILRFDYSQLGKESQLQIYRVPWKRIRGIGGRIRYETGN